MKTLIIAVSAFFFSGISLARDIQTSFKIEAPKGICIPAKAIDLGVTMSNEDNLHMAHSSFGMAVVKMNDASRIDENSKIQGGVRYLGTAYQKTDDGMFELRADYFEQCDFVMAVK